MLCEKCHKTKATVHVTEVVAGAPSEMKKRNLCKACFSESQLAKKVKGKTAGWTSYDSTRTILPDDEPER
jgi:protein-arginine kinase activator protein McsA